jgi:2-hydroxy-6-oxonona-2,4-dienedioate hydrolase
MDVSARDVLAAGNRFHTRIVATSDEGLAVVLLHGLVVSGRYMEPLARRLGRTRRVFVPDLPGFGRSSRPHRWLTVAALAQALVAWMDAVGLARAHVVGNSFGCQVLAELACASPQRVATIVMVGPTGDPRLASRSKLAARGIRAGLHEPMSEAAIVLADYVRCGPRRALATSRMAVDHHLEPAVRRVPAPLLVLRGEHDPIASEPWCRRLAAIAPCGRFGTVAGQWHAAHYSAPVAVAAMLEPFMAEGDCDAPKNPSTR